MGTWLSFIAKNFVVPIGFFVTFNLVGAKPAIGVAIAATVIQLTWLRIIRKKASPFFLVACFFTVVLGSLDLFAKTPRFFRFEPAGQNTVVGLAFLISVFAKIPLAEWFAAALPEKVRPRLDADMKDYIRNVTLIWTAYFFAKAALFLYLALRVDLGTLIILRSVIGAVTLVLMIGGEILYRSHVRPRLLSRR